MLITNNSPKKVIFFIIILTAINILAFSYTQASTVKVDVVPYQDKYHPGGSYPILLRLTIKKSWYIHGTSKGSEYLIPTTMAFKNTPDLKINDVKFPAAENRDFEYSKDPVEVYSGDMYVKAMLIVGKDTQPGEYIIEGTLSFQACSSNTCFPIENLPLTISAVIVQDNIPLTMINQEHFQSKWDQINSITTNPNRLPGSGFWLSLSVFFLAGLGLNLTPCVYPLIPITVSYFAGRDKTKKGSILISGLLFIVGIAITNSFLGVFAALTGGILGSALQHPAVLIFVAAILLTLALSFFGMWELQVPMALTSLASKNLRGYFGTFFMGLTLGIVAAPCVGPFILGLITFVAQRGDPVSGFLYFFVLSIGMGLPLCILAVFSGTIERLPMSGDWMLWIRKLMGWVLVSMAVYMLGPVINIYTSSARIFSVIAIAGGIHLGWIDKTGATLSKFLLFKKAFGLIIICGGLFFLTTAVDKREGIEWTPFRQDLVSKAVQDEKPLMLDFYAEWCAPCREMEKTLFKDPEILKLSRNFINLRVDLTTQAPFHDKLLERYKLVGVPTVVFMNKEGKEIKGSRIVGVVRRSVFLERMKLALE